MYKYKYVITPLVLAHQRFVLSCVAEEGKLRRFYVRYKVMVSLCFLFIDLYQGLLSFSSRVNRIVSNSEVMPLNFEI